MPPVRVVLAALVLSASAGTALADKCAGCACRGGPGYRDLKGQCVGHKQLYGRCGVPPTTRCTFEGKAHVGRNAVPPEWTPAQHVQWLNSRSDQSAPVPNIGAGEPAVEARPAQ